MCSKPVVESVHVCVCVRACVRACVCVCAFMLYVGLSHKTIKSHRVAVNCLCTSLTYILYPACTEGSIPDLRQCRVTPSRITGDRLNLYIA